MSRNPKAAAGKRVIIPRKPDYRDIRAASLDRAADLELVLGHVAIAERLSGLAAEIREAAR